MLKPNNHLVIPNVHPPDDDGQNNLGIGTIFHTELEKQLLTKPLQSFWVCNNFAAQNYFKKPLGPILFQRFSQINVQSLIAWISCTNGTSLAGCHEKKEHEFHPTTPTPSSPKKEIRRVTVPKRPGGDSSLRSETERTSTTEASGGFPPCRNGMEYMRYD